MSDAEKLITPRDLEKDIEEIAYVDCLPMLEIQLKHMGKWVQQQVVAIICQMKIMIPELR